MTLREEIRLEFGTIKSATKKWFQGLKTSTYAIDFQKENNLKQKFCVVKAPPKNCWRMHYIAHNPLISIAGFPKMARLFSALSRGPWKCINIGPFAPNLITYHLLTTETTKAAKKASNYSYSVHRIGDLRGKANTTKVSAVCKYVNCRNKHCRKAEFLTGLQITHTSMDPHDLLTCQQT